MEAVKNKFFSGLFRESSDLALVILVISIVMALILPIPAFMLDFLLALNITLAIIVLITVMYALSPLDFVVFPSMLLVLTLFRLSLNVATTRLILLHGDEGSMAAGSVIKSFGNFVVGGNYVVGFVIFLILVLINFIVITKGSGRIAEVAARFTLDAMPGKQMAIDADLNNGVIDELEAKERREEISKESKFQGSMDGASKFVKGDAIAGIIITVINILGGFIIGVFQNDMTMVDAAKTYTLLTVGDGLVTQIPALVISTSAGILVSRSAAEDRMGKEFAAHIIANSSPVYIASGVAFCMGLVPGLPAIPFMGLAIILAGSMYYIKQKHGEEEDIAEAKGKEAAEISGPEEVEHLLTMDTMEIEVGYGLIPLVDREQDGGLLGRIRSVRRQFASDMGIIVPPIHIRDNLKLKPSDYRILIKGVEMAKGELMVNHLMAMDAGNVSAKIEGIPTVEPAFNLPAIWISEDKEEEAKFAGYTVVDNATVIVTHLTETIKNNSAELLGRQEVQHLLDNLSKISPKAVEELVPSLLTLGIVQKVLQNMLNERVSIRDLLSIIETLADYATMSKDPDLLTEYVRQRLSRTIISPYVHPDNELPVISVDKNVENIITGGIRQTEHGAYFSIDPGRLDKIAASIKKETDSVMAQNFAPVILCSPAIRRYLRKIVEQVMPSAVVISEAELIQNIKIKALGKVSI